MNGLDLLPLKVFGFNLASFTVWFFAGAAIFWFLHYRGRSSPHPRKVIREMPSRSQILRESKYSCITLLLIALGWLSVWTMDRLRWNQFYWDLGEYSLTWLAISIIITIVLWDAWFYWTHRLMHTRTLFPIFHRTHHLSKVTNPLTGYSLDVPEAVVYVVFLPLVTMLYPLHPVSMMIFMVIQLAGNLFIHQGHEFLPAKFAESRWSYWLSSPTSHAMHHYHFVGNYGFFFQFWDRVMGTCHPQYDDELQKQCGYRERHDKLGDSSELAPARRRV